MSKKTDSLILGYLLIGTILVYVIKNYWKAILGFIALGLTVVTVQKLYLLIQKKTHLNVLRKVERNCRSTLEQFERRYFTYYSRSPNAIEELRNLLSHKTNLELTKEDVSFIIKTFFIERMTSKLNSITFYQTLHNEETYAEEIFQKFPEINFEDESQKNEFFQLLKNHLRGNRSLSTINSKKLKTSLLKKFRSEKAKKFEQKLSKESGSDFYETIFSMDCYEFEEFVANIFRNLGYEASVTKKSNDQGVDIILRKGSISTAVQVKQYTDKIGNDSVQQVVAGMKFYDC